MSIRRTVAFAALVVVVLSSCKVEPRACVKMKDLCGTELETCHELRDSTKENLGEGALDTLDGCVLQASTCSEAAGCATGSAAKATLEAAKNFANGFGKALLEGEKKDGR